MSAISTFLGAQKLHERGVSTSPGHNQNWIYSDVIELHKMAPTLRDAIVRHISALFSALKCSFPTVLWRRNEENTECGKNGVCEGFHAVLYVKPLK